MAGSGFDNDVLNAINVDFRQTVPVVGQMTQNGQLLIGSAVAPFIRAGFLTSADASVTFTYGNGTIDLKAAGGGGNITLTGDSGGGLVGNAFTLAGSGSIATSGAGSTITTALTGLTNHAILIGAGTSTITKLGPNATAGKVVMSAGAAADPIFSTPTYPSSSGSSGVIITSDGTNNIYSTSTYPNGNASGDLLYGSGTNAYSNLSLPTTAGVEVHYNGTTVTYYNPLQESKLLDDFYGSSVAPGSLPWRTQASGTGSTVTANGTDTDSAHPGTVACVSGTTTTGYGGITLNGNAGKPIILGGGAITHIWVVRIDNLSNGTDTYTLFAGLTDQVSMSTTITNGVYFTYADAGGGGTQPNWILNTVKASAATNTNSATAAATGWTTLMMQINSGGTSVQFFINGSSVATVATNIPTTSICPAFGILKSAGTTSRTVSADLFYHYQYLTTTR